MPNEEYIYYADTMNVPYGIKPKEEVKKFVISAVDFLTVKKIKALVVACNTATSVVINDLRIMYDFPIIGMEPAIKPAILGNSGKKILVLATKLTLNESKLEDLINTLDKEQKIEKLAMDKLVAFAEKYDFDSEEVVSYLKENIASININEYESIVLGCTHFIYFKNQLEKMLPSSVKIIDGNEGTVKHLKSILESKGLLQGDKNSEIRFFSSGLEENYDKVTKMLRLLNIYNR